MGAAAGQRAADEPGGAPAQEAAQGKQAGEHGHDVGDAAQHEAAGSGGPTVRVKPDRDETLQHPRCVFQVLKRHFSRYTPEMVAEVCGIEPEAFAQVAEWITANSGRDRTTAFVYSVGWTQHTVGAQYIRTASILQALLGNMGRPGGGIMALRGHASIQGSTDIPTLFNLLPGYLVDAARRAARVARGLLSRRARTPRASGATCPPTWSACSRPTGATRRRRRTTSASTTCRGSPATTAPTARSPT